VAEAAHRLGIDAKTLRRWLAQEQIPLHSSSGDGRKKGVSSEHLHLLARLHQRSLAPLPSAPPEPVGGEGAVLPTALLALPERLDALQIQIAALQQQVTNLARLLEQHPPEPALPMAPAKPSRRSKRPYKPAAPHARAASAAAKPLPKPVHVIPRVEYGEQGRYVVICPKHGVLPFEPESPEWFAWVAQQSSFRFVGKFGHFTAHHWWRVPRGAWRAHRHVRNHNYVLRLAPNQELTIAVLEQAAQALQAHLT
jgi:hypothetical protein